MRPPDAAPSFALSAPGASVAMWETASPPAGLRHPVLAHRQAAD